MENCKKLYKLVERNGIWEPSEDTIEVVWDFSGKSPSRWLGRGRTVNAYKTVLVMPKESLKNGNPVVLKELVMKRNETESQYKKRVHEYLNNGRAYTALFNNNPRRVSQIHGAYWSEGTFYVLQQFYDGYAYIERIEAKPDLEKEITRIRIAAEIVRTAHEGRIYLGDIKPENFFLPLKDANDVTDLVYFDFDVYACELLRGKGVLSSEARYADYLIDYNGSTILDIEKIQKKNDLICLVLMFYERLFVITNEKCEIGRGLPKRRRDGRSKVFRNGSFFIPDYMDSPGSKRINKEIRSIIQKGLSYNVGTHSGGYDSAEEFLDDIKSLEKLIKVENTKNEIFKSINTCDVKPHTLYEKTYVARDDKLSKIEEILHNGSDKRYCVLQGVGGTGKTELARAYAWTKRAQYKKVFFLTWPENMDKEFDIISLLEKSKYTIDGEHVDRRRMAEELFLGFDSATLVIIDNVNELSNKLFRDVFERTGAAHIILTTRSSANHLIVEQNKVLHIGNEQETKFAFDVFINNYNKNNEYALGFNDELIVEDICKMAIYNPLLLSMLAIQCRDCKMGLTELRKRMKVSFEKAELAGAVILYDDKKGSVSDLMRSYFADILRYNFDSCQKSVLTVLSMMPAEQVREGFLYELLGDVEGECAHISSACEELVRLNWLQKTNYFVSIHPLLAKVLLAFGETQLIFGEGRNDFCNHTLQNWLNMNEISQNEEKVIAYRLWQEIKEDDAYLKTNLMVSLIIDKTLVEKYWKKMTEREENPNVVFYVNKLEHGSVYGIWNIETEKTTILLDLNSHIRRYWGNDYCLEMKKSHTSHTILLLLYLSDEMRVCLPKKIDDSRVSKIDDDFSRNNKLIRSIKLPDYLEEIGSSAFRESSIEGKIDFPQTVERINEFAFYNCRQLTGSLTLPKRIVKIKPYSFAGCTSILGVEDFPKKLTRIEEGAFSYCKSLSYLGKESRIPDSINYLGSKCFEVCNITRVIIPPNVRTIPQDAFRGCNLLGFVSFSKKVEEIGESAFEDCNLKEVVFPFDSNLKKIGDSAFESGIRFGALLRLPTTLEYIGKKAFKDCKFALTNEFHSSWKYIGEEAFSGCIYMGGTIRFGENLSEIGEKAFFRSGILKVAQFPVHIHRIGNKAFANCHSLLFVEASSAAQLAYEGKNIFMDDGYQKTLVRQWCKNIFCGCSNLISIKVFGKVFEVANILDQNDIKHAKILENIKLSGHDRWSRVYPHTRLDSDLWEVSGIMSKANEKRRMMLEKVQYSYPDILKRIAEQVYIDEYEYYNLKEMKGELDLSSAQYIGAFAFRGCSGLKGNLHLENVIEIGGHAFSGCKGFKGHLYLGEQLKEIKEQTFLKCHFSGKLVLPNGLEEIGVGAFQECNKLTKLEISSGVKRIHSYAFQNCKCLTGQLIIPVNVERIDYGAFQGTNYTRIVFLNDNIYLPSYINSLSSDINDSVGYDMKNKVTIVARKNSGGFRYAQRFNLPFELLDGEECIT